MKGGDITVKVTEPCYLTGICSITPRVDYSQGNDFDIMLDNLDQIHKPQLDQIGFQDSVNTGRAWWDDTYQGNTENLS